MVNRSGLQRRDCWSGLCKTVAVRFRLFRGGDAGHGDVRARQRGLVRLPYRFFVSSTLWSKWKKHAKAAAESGYEKTGRRDAGQVLANGGVGLLLCAANWAYPHPLWWYAFLGVMAAVTADTWATEIGGLSRTPPISIKTGRRVPPGTSGGVSGLGMVASLAGGLFIGVAAWMLLVVVPGQSAPDTTSAALRPSGLDRNSRSGGHHWIAGRFVDRCDMAANVPLPRLRPGDRAGPPLRQASRADPRPLRLEQRYRQCRRIACWRRSSRLAGSGTRLGLMGKAGRALYR